MRHDRSFRVVQTVRPVIGRLDLLGRLSFGVLCIGGMTLWAMPTLAIVGVVGGIGLAAQGNLDRALAVWLGSWGAGVFAAVLFFVIAYLFWPLASDWITEWQGYAAGIGIGAAGLGLMALTVFVTDWPLALELAVPFAITFLVGFATPGWVLGLTASHAPRQEARRR